MFTAKEVIAMWQCPKCGESVEDDFEVCWNCTAARDGAQAETTDDADAPAESILTEMVRHPAAANPYSSPAKHPGDETFVPPLDRDFVLRHTVFLACLMMGVVALLLLGACAAVYLTLQWISRLAEYDVELLREPLSFSWYLYNLGPTIVCGLCYFGLIFGIARFASAVRRLVESPEADSTAAFSALNRCLVLVFVVLLVLLAVKVLAFLYEVRLFG